MLTPEPLSHRARDALVGTPRHPLSDRPTASAGWEEVDIRCADAVWFPHGYFHMSGSTPPPRALPPDNSVRVPGAREHNLKSIDVDIPRDALVVFTGISGSGKSSLAFGTLYAEAQRRYFESVSPYARRLIEQVAIPDVDSIEGLPPAVALQQQRGTTSSRSSVGSITTLSNLLRMLYSRVGTYPRGQQMLYAEDFSPNTPQGACAHCHGLGYVYDVAEAAM